ncbi:MAG: serine/threonine-protein kinase [Candidatus Calescibacterium sp.]|nr:serine/threonine protein kinase [Candidatus Calescibacterium sp.]MDW8194846.1 serine/threonine-protein kinase [Candidatus Calescibacterium sp.]
MKKTFFITILILLISIVNANKSLLIETEEPQTIESSKPTYKVNVQNKQKKANNNQRNNNQQNKNSSYRVENYITYPHNTPPQEQKLKNKKITLELHVTNIQNQEIPSYIEIQNNGLKEIVKNSSRAIFKNIEPGSINIYIHPENPQLKKIRISSQINKDTYLRIQIPPSKFDVVLPIFNTASKKIEDIKSLNFKILFNNTEYKNFQTNENTIIIPIELNSQQEYNISDLKQEEIDSKINRIQTMISEISVSFQKNKEYKDENIRLKITPGIIKNRFPQYKRIVILENKLPNPYLQLLPYLLLLLIAISYLIYRYRNKRVIVNLKRIDQGKVQKLSFDTSSNPRVSNYILLEKLGAGATSVVYKAQNIKNKSIVALKLLHKHLFSETWFKERILNEIEINKILTHPNIIRMLDYDIEGDQPFLAFEYVEGKNLSKILEEKKKLSLNEALKIWIQLLEALDYAHHKGIVHRDLKPENIMIRNDGTAKITDFGISKKLDKALNLTQDFVGTPWYMSPEQIKNNKVDNRSDIYSLGVIVYQMITGSLPFEPSDNIYAIFKAHMLNNPISTNIHSESYIPPDIEKIIRKMIEKDPKKRYQYCYEIIQDLTPQIMVYTKN